MRFAIAVEAQDKIARSKRRRGDGARPTGVEVHLRRLPRERDVARAEQGDEKLVRLDARDSERAASGQRQIDTLAAQRPGDGQPAAANHRRAADHRRRDGDDGRTGRARAGLLAPAAHAGADDQGRPFDTDVEILGDLRIAFSAGAGRCVGREPHVERTLDADAVEAADRVVALGGMCRGGGEERVKASATGDR